MHMFKLENEYLQMKLKLQNTSENNKNNSENSYHIKVNINQASITNATATCSLYNSIYSTATCLASKITLAPHISSFT